MEFPNIPNNLDTKTRQSTSRATEISVETGIDIKQKLEPFNQMKIINMNTFLPNMNNLVYFIEPILTSQKYFEISSDMFSIKPNKIEVFERQKIFFEENLNNLLTRYKGKYVAIINEKVVDSNKNEIKLIKKLYRKRGYVPMYIGRVTTEKIILRVSSPRIKED